MATPCQMPAAPAGRPAARLQGLHDHIRHVVCSILLLIYSESVLQFGKLLYYFALATSGTAASSSRPTGSLRIEMNGLGNPVTDGRLPGCYLLFYTDQRVDFV